MLVSEADLHHVFGKHAKQLERMSWKAMDFDEFSESYLKLLQDLGRLTIRVNRVMLKKALANSHLSLTTSEMALLSDKVMGTINYIKTRLRDAGSGKCLPTPAVSLNKIWSSHHTPKADPTKPAKPSRSSTSTSLTTSMPSSSSAGPYPKDIRSVFGLEPKVEKKSSNDDMMDVVSVSESEGSDARKASVPVVAKPSASSTGSTQVGLI